MGFVDIFKKSSNSKNFRYLDKLIHSGVKEIVLDSNILLGRFEKIKYENGIKLDVDDLVIDGNGHAIDAQGKARIFFCTGKNITLKNIILKNGYTLDCGGAISHTGGELSIIESILDNNASRWGDGGGAIYHAGGKLTITESTLTGNEVSEVGGPACRYPDVHYFGGAIFHTGGELSIIGSTLTGNNAFDYGGAIFHTGGELSIIGSTLAGNRTFDYGGAICHAGGELSIIGSTLTGNHAFEYGAIDNMDVLTIIDSTLTENTARLGGAIGNGGVLTITESTLSNNAAQRGNDPCGGAIYNKGELTIIDSALTGNTAKWGGGAIDNQRDGDVEINNCQFQENVVNKSGGAILNFGKLSVTKTMFGGNSAQERNGGAISNQETGIMNALNVEFNQNIANKKGGAVFTVLDENLNLKNCNFKDNKPDDVN